MVVYLIIFSYRQVGERNEDIIDYMVNTLLKYLAHPLASIRKETYQSITSLLKVGLHSGILRIGAKARLLVLYGC